MEIELNFFNYDVDVKLEIFSENLGNYFCDTINYIISRTKIEPKYKDWKVSIELSGGPNNLKYFYSSKSNKYKIIYFYFFIDNSINKLSRLEKEKLIFKNLILKINEVFIALKLDLFIDEKILQVLSDFFVKNIENTIFSYEFKKNGSVGYKKVLNETIVFLKNLL